MAEPKIEPLTDEEQLARVQLAKQSAQWTYLCTPEQTVYRDVLRWHATVLALQARVTELETEDGKLRAGASQLRHWLHAADDRIQRARKLLEGSEAATVYRNTAWLEEPQPTEEAENADTG